MASRFLDLEVSRLSIISSYSTRIRVAPRAARGSGSKTDPTWQMLHEAVIAAAAQLGGEVRSEVLDYNGATRACDFAVVGPGFPRGVGVSVSPGGEVRFMYDDYGGYKHQAKAICDLITQNYTTMAVSRALRSLNYEVEVAESGEGVERRIMVRGTL